MHSQPYGPVHGNWIWPATTAVAVGLLTVAALSYNGPVPCHASSARAAAGATAGARHSGGASAGVDAAGRTQSPTAAAARSGLALYYDPGTAMGSCALGPFPPGGFYVSLPPAQYDRGATCGSYLDVQGPRGRIRAEVVDLCAGCGPQTINLSEAAFARIADTRPGSAPVRYAEAADPRLSGPLVVRVLATSTAGLLALQILNHGNRLVSVAAHAAHSAAATAPPVADGTSASAAWQPLRLGSNGFWVATVSPAPGLFTLRIVDDRGHQVILRRLALTAGSWLRTRAWMYRGSPAVATGLAAASRRPQWRASRRAGSGC